MEVFLEDMLFVSRVENSINGVNSRRQVKERVVSLAVAAVSISSSGSICSSGYGIFPTGFFPLPVFMAAFFPSLAVFVAWSSLALPVYSLVSSPNFQKCEKCHLMEK